MFVGFVGLLVGVALPGAACAEGARPALGVVEHLELALTDDLGHDHGVDVHLRLPINWRISMVAL